VVAASSGVRVTQGHWPCWRSSVQERRGWGRGWSIGSQMKTLEEGGMLHAAAAAWAFWESENSVMINLTPEVFSWEASSGVVWLGLPPVTQPPAPMMPR
jgi:hypothetical protein